MVGSKLGNIENGGAEENHRDSKWGHFFLETTSVWGSNQNQPKRWWNWTFERNNQEQIDVQIKPIFLSHTYVHVKIYLI